MKIIPESDNVLEQIKELLTGVRIEDIQPEDINQRVSRNNTTSIPKGRILLIDDNPDYGRRLIKWCTGKDYIVTVARDTKEARRLARLATFDAVIKSSEIVSVKKPRR